MQTIIPGVSTPSTGLGYGCSLLMGRITQKESAALLRAAYDSGIRHFDVAPSYGFGQAESVLGEALRSVRHEITIATKFGIQPPRNRNLLGIARGIVLPVIRHVPSIKSRLSRAAQGLAARARFSPEELRTSLEASLSALRTDCIDILLLHEAVASDLSDELLEELHRAVKAGKICTFGIGSEAAQARRIHRTDRRFCPVMQFEWSVLSGDEPSYPESFVIAHRALVQFSALRAWLDGAPAVARTWSRELGLDVTTPSVLARLMLAAARSANRGGITLFSSRRPRNIAANAELLRDDACLGVASRFAALVAKDARAAVTGGLPAMTAEAAARR